MMWTWQHQIPCKSKKEGEQKGSRNILTNGEGEEMDTSSMI